MVEKSLREGEREGGSEREGGERGRESRREEVGGVGWGWGGGGGGRRTRFFERPYA